MIQRQCIQSNAVRPSVLINAIAIVVTAVALMVMPGCNDGAQSSATQVGSVATADESAIVMEFDVKGMSCEGCVFSVRSAIAALDGVQACDVSLADERAAVAVKDETTERAIIEAIEKLDFTITRRGSAAASPEADAVDAADAVDG